jgi:gas vesicle protein
LNPKTQYDDASTGLLEIPLIIHRYQVLDAVYRSSEEVDGQLKTAFEEKLADLYCNILEFQVRAVCQWSRHALHQYGRDIFKADGWAKLFKDIKDLDSACKDIAQTMDAGLFRIVLDKQSQHLQELISSWYSQQQKTLEKLLDQMQQLNVNAEAQRREQQSREEQDQEIKCHQAFGPSTYVSHKNRNPLRVPGTCKWFLDHPQFLKWKQDELSSLLWVSADPGCGKSVLARTLIDEGLLSDDLLTPSVCYFFFKDGSPEQQGAAKSISAILHQLFNDQPHLIRHALEDYRREGQNISSSFEKTWSILTIAAADPAARKIVCVLDALDECEEDSRKLIIDSLKTLYSDTEHTQSLIVKFLVTSRPYEDIQRHFRSLTKDFPTIRLKGEQESEAISQEINLVIRERLVPEISVELDLSSAVEASLFDMLLKVPNRTYLWLHLISDEMRQTSGSTSAKGLGQLVSRIPKSVDEAYDKILNRARDFALCRRLLHLVLAARRSLSVAEMNVAFHIKEGMRSTADLDLETDARFQERIRNLCGLFITIVNNEIFLIHQTAREYLVQPETCTCHKSVWKHSFSSEESERLLAKCCIFYLRFAEFEMDNPFWIDGNATSRAFFWSRNGYKRREVRRRYKATLESAVHKAVGISDLCISIVPFFGYSSHFWLEHFLNKETSDEVALASAIDLCDPRSRSFTQWMIIHFDSVHSYLLHQSDTPLGESIEGLLTFSSLMVAVRLGWHWLVCKLLEDDTKDVNYSDIHGDTALTLAAALGNATVVKMLVAAGAKVNAVTFGNKSALHKAIKSGDKETTRILIESDANLNCKNDRQSWLELSTS